MWWRGERFLQNVDQHGFPGALDAIEADEEGRRVGVAGVLGLMLGEQREDERDHVLAFVILDFRHPESGLQSFDRG